MLVVVMGVLMAAVDTTIVVLALPDMERSLHIALSAVVWVIVAYILVVTILATQVGRLGDIFGRARMYELGFLVFIVGSCLCASATSEASAARPRTRLMRGFSSVMTPPGAARRRASQSR